MYQSHAWAGNWGQGKLVQSMPQTPANLTCSRYVPGNISSLQRCDQRCQTFVSTAIFTHKAQVQYVGDSLTKKCSFIICFVHMYICVFLFACPCNSCFFYFSLQTKNKAQCKILTSLSYIIGTEFWFVRNYKFLKEYSMV